jgi:hypothetical protein
MPRFSNRVSHRSRRLRPTRRNAAWRHNSPIIAEASTCGVKSVHEVVDLTCESDDCLSQEMGDSVAMKRPRLEDDCGLDIYEVGERATKEKLVTSKSDERGMHPNSKSTR